MFRLTVHSYGYDLSLQTKPLYDTTRQDDIDVHSKRTISQLGLTQNTVN